MGLKYNIAKGWGVLDKRKAILDWLQAQGVPYTLVEHPAAYDMQDIADFGVDKHGTVAKNLFLRDSKKGKRHFLVTVAGEAKVDLSSLGEILDERLSFASEDRLEKYLKLKKGEVTPLAVYFDTDSSVEVFLDKRLAACERVGVHPADNTATVFLAFGDLVRLVEKAGNQVKIITIGGGDDV